jgi:hypothetical protein
MMKEADGAIVDSNLQKYDLSHVKQSRRGAKVGGEARR